MAYAEILGRIFDADDMGVGGGCGGALAGAQSCGLAGLVAKLSIGKDYGLSDARYEEIIAECEIISKKLQDGADNDAAAYAGIAAAFKLPKSTDDEKASRRVAIDDAMVGAAIVPRDNAFLCKKAADICYELLGHSNPACGSDLACGCYLADVGVRVCMLNIEVNVGSIKDQSKTTELKKDIEELDKVCRLARLG